MVIGAKESANVVKPDLDTVSQRPPRSYWRESLERLLHNRLGMLCVSFIVFLAAVALAAPLISLYVTHYTPYQIDLLRPFNNPSHTHWLGTDQLGRDTLTRLVWGTQVSLGVGFLTVAIALVVGTTVGLVAGFYGGWIDEVLMRLVDTVLGIPAIFFLLLAATLLRPGLITIAVVIASISWVSVARLVRSEVLSVKSQDFILATYSLGATNFRIIFGHILPAVIPVMIVASSLAVGQIILIEAALDFLGLGIPQPTPSWGNMITTAQQYFDRATLLEIYAGLAIFLTVLATNIAGNAVRDAFDPSLRY
jgi:peptide/nickel transport system permease protein